MKMNPRDRYEFPYMPVLACSTDDAGAGTDVVVATSAFVEGPAVRDALAGYWGEVSAETLLSHAPLFWTRVRVEKPCVRADLAASLGRAGIPVRYVASSRRQSMRLPPPIDFDGAETLRPSGWKHATSHEVPRDPDSDGRWFLRDRLGGLAVDRERCGTGVGACLAVIDDDAADFEQLDLDATVLVGVGRPSRASGHGATMIGWAVGARTYEGPRFWGVAPGASVRAYLIPRPSDDVVPLALAVARAAIDGADVIVCATFVDGMTSPMLDDALSMATALGREGRGCAVVFPTGREASSPRRSIHASLSLSLADPASDPRVFCVAPGGKNGGWFMWREQHGRLRPFSNRGPAVRLLAPGDDLAYPFLAEERPFHAESSGASALAAGVLLLVLSSHPSLRIEELFDLLQRCASAPEPLSADARDELADRADVLPLERDSDAHDAKHGYGRMHALRTCLAAADPIALELIGMGEPAAARAWADLRRAGGVEAAYSPAFARWAVRALLADPAAEHALRVVLRHLRLVSRDKRRADAHPRGAVARQLALVLRALSRSPADAPASVRAEIARLDEALRRELEDAAAFETALAERACRVFAADNAPSESRASSTPSAADHP